MCYVCPIIGPVGPPCANPLTSFDHKNNSIKGCFSDVRRMDVKAGRECVVMSIGLHDHWQFERAIHGMILNPIIEVDSTLIEL